jgi:hypothetical protein
MTHKQNSSGPRFDCNDSRPAVPSHHDERPTGAHRVGASIVAITLTVLAVAVLAAWHSHGHDYGNRVAPIDGSMPHGDGAHGTTSAAIHDAHEGTSHGARHGYAGAAHAHGHEHETGHGDAAGHARGVEHTHIVHPQGHGSHVQNHEGHQDQNPNPHATPTTNTHQSHEHRTQTSQQGGNRP